MTDVLDTVIKPAHSFLLADVIKMGFVTILRTGLAYFLAHEIKDLEETHEIKRRRESEFDLQKMFEEDERSEKNSSRSHPSAVSSPRSSFMNHGSNKKHE